jgi:hypothetical protein
LENINENNFLIYEFFCDKKTNYITLIQKYTQKDLDQTLKELKICHNSCLLIIKKEYINKKENKENKSKLDTDIMDKYIGLDFQPISLTIILNNKDHQYKVYNNINLSELKNRLQKHFNISYNISIKLKNEHKSINLDEIEFDRKNKIPLNLKQMKVINESIIVISRNEKENPINLNQENNDNTNNNNNKYDETNNNNNKDKEKLNPNNNSDSLKIKVSNIVCLEDDRNDVRIINYNIKKTFENFIKKVIKKFSLTDDIIIRLRK